MILHLCWHRGDGAGRNFSPRRGLRGAVGSGHGPTASLQPAVPPRHRSLRLARAPRGRGARGGRPPDRRPALRRGPGRGHRHPRPVAPPGAPPARDRGRVRRGGGRALRRHAAVRRARRRLLGRGAGLRRADGAAPLGRSRGDAPHRRVRVRAGLWPGPVRVLRRAPRGERDVRSHDGLLHPLDRRRGGEGLRLLGAPPRARRGRRGGRAAHRGAPRASSPRGRGLRPAPLGGERPGSHRLGRGRGSVRLRRRRLLRGGARRLRRLPDQARHPRLGRRARDPDPHPRPRGHRRHRRARAARRGPLSERDRHLLRGRRRGPQRLQHDGRHRRQAAHRGGAPRPLRAGRAHALSRDPDRRGRLIVEGLPI